MSKQKNLSSLSNYLGKIHSFAKVGGKLISLPIFLFLNWFQNGQLEFLCADFHMTADEKELMILRRQVYHHSYY